MDQLSRALGIGSKGSLRFELDRASYEPGDIVTGRVSLSVSVDVKIKGALVLVVYGEEYVKFNEMHGEMVVPRKYENQLMADQVMLFEESCTSLAVGEYDFPFRYQLRSTLPGTFHIDHRCTPDICDIEAAVKYELRLRVPLKGVLTADIKAKQPLFVNVTQTAQFIQPRTEATVQHAKLCGIIRQGYCEISGTLDSDVCVVNESLQIRVSVTNGSNLDVKSVSVRLNETLVIRANNDRGEIKAQTCLVKKNYHGVKAGATLTDQTYSLDLIGRSERYAVRPPVASSIVKTSHHIEIRCSFLLSPNVHVEIPVKIVASQGREVTRISQEVVMDHMTKTV
uniref:Arrestin C-terminal-like domain-containing protein n=1 Tax=Peronospora matthiolae TaxID=2874970 RepID=A0AAV1TLN1_9STRA